MLENIVFGFLTIGLVEGFVKPLATYVVKKQTNKWLPKLLNSFDPIMPDLIKNKTEQEIRSLILTKYKQITESDVVDPEYVVKTFEKAYSPLVNARKSNG